MALLNRSLINHVRIFFITAFPKILICLFLLVFLAIPLGSVLLDGSFWQGLFYGWALQVPFLIAKSLATMAPSVGFSALTAYTVGSVTSATVLGRRHTSRTITLCFMFALYGTVLGLISSFSGEFAGKELFASIATVATTLFGYLISKDLEPRLKAMVPAAMICFLLSFMFTVHYYRSLADAADSIRN